MDKLVDFIADLGSEVGKNSLLKYKKKSEIKALLCGFIQKQEEINELNSIEEEIDFEGLSRYILQGLTDDAENYFLGTYEEWESAKQTIIMKAQNYAGMDNARSAEKAEKLMIGILDILHRFYHENLDETHKLQAAEIGKTVSEIIREERKSRDNDILDKLDEQGKNIDSIKRAIEQKDSPQNKAVMEDIYKKEGERFYNFTYISGEKCTVDNMFLPEIYSFFAIDDTLDNEILKENNEHDRESLLNKALDVLHEQRLLLIVGDYGSGKTVLLKALHRIIGMREDADVFFSFCQYIFPSIQKNDKNDIYFFWDQLHQEGKKQYIFLDGLDDLNLPVDETKSCLEECMNWIMDYLADRPDYYIVMTSRKFVEVEGKKETIQNHMAFQYLLNFEREEFQYIKTREFNSEEIGRWIEQYAGIYKKSMDKATVKKDHGRIMKSLANPLFLFIFMKRYMKTGAYTEEKYYYYYQEFINQTIEGKYYLENQNGALVLQKGNFVNQYQELLEYIAFDILQNNSNIIDIGNEIWQEEILLGERLLNRNYYLRMNQFSTATNEKMNNSTWKAGMKNANFLNCYFIAKAGDYVFFKDVNVLFLLAARRIYKSLVNVIQDKNCIFDVDDIDKIQAIDFYPQLLDFILYQIEKDGRREEFLQYAYSAVSQEPLTSKLILLQKEKVDVISKILLLYIFLIKFNDTSYRTPELQHVVKDMTHYNKLYKEIQYRKKSGNSYIYSIERYFMGVNLVEATIKRLNLKYYNFQGAAMSDVVFIQCQFKDNNFKNINLRKLEYRLCSIQKLELLVSNKDDPNLVSMNDCTVSQSELSGAGKIELKRCQLDNLTLKVYAKEIVEIEECIIRNLNIKSEDGTSSGKVIFSNCVFKNQISLKKMRGKIEVRQKSIKDFGETLFVGYENVKISGIEKIC